jgi:polar amino acid transport system substrate-binding protein
MVAGAKAGEWDIIFFEILPERTRDINFSAPYAQIEGSYLVAKDSPIAVMSDIDRPGIRIALLEKGAADLYLTNTLVSMLHLSMLHLLALQRSTKRWKC